MTRCLFAFATVCAAAIIAATASAGQPAQKDPVFRVGIQAKLTMDVGEKDGSLEADGGFVYTWKREGKIRTLVVDSLEMRAVQGETELMNAKMSRSGIIDLKNGMKTETKVEDAPKQLKQMLTDIFGSPICKIELDETGKEAKRTIVAGPGAKVMIDTGMVSNALMFHPWYPPNKDEWQADLEVSAGNTLASGKATYTKVAGGKGGQAVKVAGTLTADGVKGPGGLIIKDGKYKVTGEQTYDPERKEWIAGKLTLDVSCKVSDGTKVVGSVKGEIVATVKMLPEKK
jgi:hypothetical protein